MNYSEAFRSRSVASRPTVGSESEAKILASSTEDLCNFRSTQFGCAFSISDALLVSSWLRSWSHDYTVAFCTWCAASRLTVGGKAEAIFLASSREEDCEFRIGCIGGPRITPQHFADGLWRVVSLSHANRSPWPWLCRRKNMTTSDQHSSAVFSAFPMASIALAALAVLELLRSVSQSIRS